MCLNISFPGRQIAINMILILLSKFAEDILQYNNVSASFSVLDYIKIVFFLHSILLQWISWKSEPWLENIYRPQTKFGAR